LTEDHRQRFATGQFLPQILNHRRKHFGISPQ
jgi:hypothetical protein